MSPRTSQLATLREQRSNQTAKTRPGIKLGAPTKGQDVIDQVRRLKVGGASNQAISRALKMSPSTVAKY